MKRPTTPNPIPPSPTPTIDSLAQFGQQIRTRRQSLHLTLDQLAQRTHISKPYLSNIETARAPGPASDEKLARLEQALDLPPGQLQTLAAWLRTPPSVRALIQQKSPNLQPPRRPDGTINLDSLLSPPTSSTSPAHTAITPQENRRAAVLMGGVGGVKRIPLINRVAAGPATEFTDLDYPAGIADQYVPTLNAPPLTTTNPQSPTIESPNPDPSSSPGGGGGGGGGEFAVRVSGDSMFPTYVDGEIVIVGVPRFLTDASPDQSTLPATAADNIQNGDVCLVRLDASENFAQTLKRVYISPTTIRLVPINPAYATRILSPEQITGLYPVLWKLTPIKK